MASLQTDTSIETDDEKGKLDNVNEMLQILRDGCDDKTTWLSRYGLGIRINMFVNLICVPLTAMIMPSLISSMFQMIITIGIALLIVIVLLVFDNIANGYSQRLKKQYEITIGFPYFLVNFYFILQNVCFSDDNNHFDIYKFLLVYTCVLLETSIFGYLRYAHVKLLNIVLLSIWNVMSILKLLNIIPNDFDNADLILTFKRYILVNFVLLFVKVCSLYRT